MKKLGIIFSIFRMDAVQIQHWIANLLFKRSDKCSGRLSFGYFSLAKQRKVTDAFKLTRIQKNASSSKLLL